VKNETFFQEGAFSLSVLSRNIRMKTFYKALRKVGHFGSKHAQLWLNQADHTLPKAFPFQVLRADCSPV